NTAQYHLRTLEKEGYLQRERGRARAFQLTEKARRALGEMGRHLDGLAANLADSARGLAQPARRPIPLLGRITAGALDLAVEDMQGAVDLADFVHADENTFALRVEGDSMAGAGILNGDVVIVRRQSALENGEIGVVLVNGETTVKYFSIEGDAVVLRPANERYRDIRVARHHPGLEVLGRVIGVVRKL
ncbi:MAG: transcriptional repressor LexA, partial [Candidatus Sumerlaeia bacterium]|nr:transcriptional repressor LexA [Candidatus Sumerlaeia bacterium]